MDTNNKIFWTLVVLTLFISVSVQNVVAIVEEKSLNDLTTSSDAIIAGKVISKESYWKDGNIFTDVTISASQHFKGKSDSQFLIKIPGGTVGNIYAEVSDVPLFEDNEDVLLFLKGNQVVGWNQGKYTIEDNKIKETGESVAKFIDDIKQNLASGQNFRSDNQNVKNENIWRGVGITDITLPVISHITSVTPSSGPAKAAELGSGVAASDSTQVTINGLNFGPSSGSVKFWRSGTTGYEATIVSWTDTKIVAKVPGKISSSGPDGTGNMYVVKSDGTTSDNYGNFGVTYSYGGGKWPGNKVTYMVNPNTADTTGELAAVQAAANTWNNAGANFGFVYGGPTSKTSVAMDGENSIIWVNYDTGSVATTITYWFGTGPKTIVESDIVFNDLNNNWGTDSSPTKMDVQTVATHELGHWLQLLDLYGSADSKKMMYGYVSDGGIKRSLSTDDIAGIIDIYGSTIIDKVAPMTNISGVTKDVIYGNNVIITLVATDNAGGSGVKNTTYTINGGAMTTYSSPFIVSNIGKNTVTYKSADNAGNVEKTKSISFTINSGDILTYYRGLGQSTSIVETNDLLKAADDWRGDIIPPGFSVSITTSQLLALADEWRNS